MKIKDIQILAEEHGLFLSDEIKFNEMGIDFKVGFANDTDENQWILRIPRRHNLGNQIAKEKSILQLVSKYLSIQVPDWKIATPKLVAYPLLDGKPALTYDAQTYEVTWNMDKDSPQYIPSLAKALVQLHNIPEEQASVNGLNIVKHESLRSEIADRLQIVKSELGISYELETR